METTEEYFVRKREQKSIDLSGEDLLSPANS